MPSEKKTTADLTFADVRKAIRKGLKAEGYPDSLARKLANELTDAGEMVIHQARLD